MTRIERHPAPEKMFRQITTEAVNALALGEQADSQTVSRLETGVRLIAKAWDLPQEKLDESLDLIQREKERIRAGNAESVLPRSELWEDYDGKMIVELLWGLFETAVTLEDAADRAAIHELALLLAEFLNLDSWIADSHPADK